MYLSEIWYGIDPKYKIFEYSELNMKVKCNMQHRFLLLLGNLENKNVFKNESTMPCYCPNPNT